MDNDLSRRNFLKKSAVAIGTVAMFDVSALLGTHEGSAFEAWASEGLEEDNMAHISIKLWPGRSQQTKQRLADAIAEDVVNILGCDEKSVSISIEDVSSGDWKKEVYDPEIKRNRKNVYKQPGYSM